MKTQKESTISLVRNKYTAQFKEHVLKLADWNGILTAVLDLGLAKLMLYS